jgi:iron complex transport system substrate-binding protein
MHQLSRRDLLSGIAGLGAFSLLTACSAGKPTAGATTAGPGFPVSVTHAFGSTTIPSPPKRVVSIGFSDHDVLLALGVKPIAVREWFGNKPSATWQWATKELGTLRPTVLGSGDLSFEAIAKLAPDLIVSAYAGLTKDEYDKLSRIAPTVAQSGKYPNYSTPWQDMTATIGAAVGQPARARKLIADVEARFTAAKTAHPAFASATTVVMDCSLQSGAYSILGPDDPRGRIMRALGLSYPANVTAKIPKGQFYVPLSREHIELVEVDALVVLVYDPAAKNALLKDPLYQQLDVVKRGSVTYLDNVEPPLNAAMGFSTVLSLPYFLDRFVGPLAASLK